MRFWPIAVLTLLVTGCSAADGTPVVEGPEATDPPPAVAYVTTDDFASEVLDSALPVLVDFTATWCVPCRLVDPVIESLMPDMAGRAKVFKLDIDEDPDIYAQLRVNGIPTVIFFNNGLEQDRIGSPQSRETYVKYLEAMIAGRSAFDVSVELLDDDAFRRHFILSRRAEDLPGAIERYPDLLTKPFENGQMPLSLILNTPSVYQNDRVELALAQGAAPTTRDLVGLGRCEEFEGALAEDPEAIDRADADGATPLYLALARMRRLENGGCLTTIVDLGADPTANSSQRYDLRRSVVLSEDVELMSELLERGLDPRQTDEFGNNMLHWAATYRYADGIRLLVERGMDVTIANSEGNSAVDIVRRSRDRRVEMLGEAEETGATERIEPLQQSIEEADRVLELLEA